jgi:DNA-binding NarL/FixJ family response regulator
MMKKVWRVVVADDELSLHSALRLLLTHESGIAVVGDAAEAGSARQQVAALRPDLVLLDWELPGATGASLVEELRMAAPQTRIIALSSRPEARPAALAAGADAFVCKGDPPDHLLATMRGLLPVEHSE